MRAFVALPLPDAVCETLALWCDDLGVGRAVPEDNMHLTLAFLDEVDLPTLQVLNEGLEALVFDPFPLRLSGIDLMGARGSQVLAIRGQGGAALSGLQSKVAQAARMAGIDLPRRRFRPHVTLVRLGPRLAMQDEARLGRFLAAFGDAALDPFEVSRLALCRSHLTRDGAEYEVLADYPAAP